MSTAVWHELGPVSGACTVCAAVDTLSVGVARFHRNLLERLRREYSAPPARFVTCRECGWRWSVRADDSTADGVRHRAGIARTDTPAEEADVETGPRAATRNVLPAPREGRRRSRDWTYPQS